MYFVSFMSIMPLLYQLNDDWTWGALKQCTKWFYWVFFNQNIISANTFIWKWKFYKITYDTEIHCENITAVMVVFGFQFQLWTFCLGKQLPMYSQINRNCCEMGLWYLLPILVYVNHKTNRPIPTYTHTPKQPETIHCDIA